MTFNTIEAMVIGMTEDEFQAFVAAKARTHCNSSQIEGIALDLEQVREGLLSLYAPLRDGSVATPVAA